MTTMRHATADDIPRLVELGRLMHAESPFYSRMTFDAEKLAATIAHTIESPRGFARVLEQEEGIQGGMLALVTPHWFSKDLAACDLALFIDPMYRGGLGAVRLLNAYAVWARDAGATLVQFGIMTGVNVETTARLCERLGWRRAGMVMEI